MTHNTLYLCAMTTEHTPFALIRVPHGWALITATGTVLARSGNRDVLLLIARGPVGEPAHDAPSTLPIQKAA